mgnify:CR=1 FL=1
MTELQGDYYALKSDEDENTVIKLVVNNDFLKGCKSPLNFIRRLELVFKTIIEVGRRRRR